MDTRASISIGTCSWKYDSSEGLVYSGARGGNYLEQYRRHYTTVEVDQWFWSLLKSGMPVLPRADVVREYDASVPPGFLFSIKVPNGITLTHHYTKGKGASLIPNPHFLSTGLMTRFLQTIDPLGDHIGPLMFQFEYLNKMKMNSLHRFLEMFEVFRQGLPEGCRYCVEIRIPNWLRGEYFDYLAEHGLGHVFLQGRCTPWHPIHNSFQLNWWENSCRPPLLPKTPREEHIWPLVTYDPFSMGLITAWFLYVLKYIHTYQMDN